MPNHESQTNYFTIFSLTSYYVLAALFLVAGLWCAYQIITITSVAQLPDKFHEFWAVLLKLTALGTAFTGCRRFALTCIDRTWAVNVLNQSCEECSKADEVRFGFVQSVIGRPLSTPSLHETGRAILQKLPKKHRIGKPFGKN
jgi:hypothetical protein